MENLRELLIDTIIEYSGEEFEDKASLIDLAKESDNSLITRVITLLDWYHEQYNQS
jgi:hypothetical protein